MAFQVALTGAILDHIFGKATYTPPTTLYVGLSTTTGGDSISEVTGAGYERMPMLTADWNSADIAGNAFTTNAVTITFPAATANWGTVKEAILCDALTDGECLGRADAAIDKAISSGDVVIILAEKLKFILL